MKPKTKEQKNQYGSQLLEGVSNASGKTVEEMKKMKKEEFLQLPNAGLKAWQKLQEK